MLASEIASNTTNNSDYTQYLKTPSLKTCTFKCVTQEDIVKAIDNLENKNSSGHDGISNKVLKYIKLELSNSLTLIVNQMLTTGIFPDSFKKSKITPIFKKGDSSLLINYRPISLLPTTGVMLNFFAGWPIGPAKIYFGWSAVSFTCPRYYYRLW